MGEGLPDDVVVVEGSLVDPKLFEIRGVCDNVVVIGLPVVYGLPPSEPRLVKPMLALFVV